MRKELIIGLILGLILFIFISNKEKLLKSSPSPTSPLKPSSTLISPTTPLNPKLIEDAYVEDLEIEGIKYVFDRGKITREDGKNLNTEEVKKVRQLVFFYLWTKEDPLFTSPDLNIEGLKESVELLKELENEYNNLTKRKEHFFPISFLEKIPEVKKAEQEFLDLPVQDSAKQLILKYKSASQSYKSEINNYLKILEDNRQSILDTNFVFFNTVTTKSIILSDIKKIAENANRLTKEVEKRANCLTKGEDCLRPASEFKIPEEKKPTANKTEILDLEILFPTLSDLERKEIRGPYFVKTNCFGWFKDFKEQESSFYLHQRTERKTVNNEQKNISYYFPKLATNNFYRKVARNFWESDFPKGYDYTFQPESTNYLCTNLEYQAKLAEIDYFWNLYINDPVLSKVKDDASPALKKANDIEKAFFSSPNPSGEDLSLLSSYYAYFYKTSKNKETKDELLKRYLIINRELENAPFVLNRIAANFLRVIEKEKKTKGFTSKKENLYSYVYLFRTSWSILYFPFSPSFWRSNENLEYIEKRMISSINQKDGSYIDYKEAKKRFGLERIKKMHEAAEKYNSMP